MLSMQLPPAVQAEAANSQPNAVTIPLNRIWAYEMPGTRDVRELEPDKFGPKVHKLDSAERRKRYDESFTYQIVSHLRRAKYDQPAAPGFAVSGSGAHALRLAHAVLVGGQNRKRRFPAGSETSLVFSSKLFDYYVHLHKVQRQGATITIKYFVVPHRGNGTAHFALIPLGILPAGQWQVVIRRSPLPERLKTTVAPAPGPGVDASIVCRPFNFTIERHDAK
jgi:hypothetical protein